MWIYNRQDDKSLVHMTVDYWQSFIEATNSFHSLTVLLFVGKCCEIDDYCQRSNLLTLDKISQEINCIYRAGKKAPLLYNELLTTCFRCLILHSHHVCDYEYTTLQVGGNRCDEQKSAEQSPFQGEGFRHHSPSDQVFPKSKMLFLYQFLDLNSMGYACALQMTAKMEALKMF